ncbi:MAG: 4-hydroxythreonine-4-phosphate dehydrogenase PdxA [Rhodospirillales bacterium]
MNPAYSGDRPLSLTMGEPAGIGGETTIKAWLRRNEGVPPFFTVDDPERIEELAQGMGLTAPVEVIDSPKQAISAFAQRLPVMARPLAARAVPGKPDPANCKTVISSIETALAHVKSGGAAAIVTNPINKMVLHEAGFGFPGHTEFLAHLAGRNIRPVMMMACPGLRVALVTIHVSLREAIESVDREAIVETATITEAALRDDFAIARPRLAVAGLNPHAGEGGVMGPEDLEIVAPAVEAIAAKGIDVFGPVPADTLFSPQRRKEYDAAVCLYHDQALIPIKAIAFESAVNITLGLGFVRTSPAHGTAFDIAGGGRADETSLIEALKTAAEMAKRRAAAESA